MSRYTAKALESDIKEINQGFSESGYLLRVMPRNGYTAVDVCRVVDGRVKVLNNLECGSPRECLAAANGFEPPQK